MNSLAIVSLLALLPVCLTTNCYVCNPGSSGCDPFSSGGSGVSTTSSYTNCYKVTTGSASGTYRGGSSACSASSGSSASLFCCSTDYCNGATVKYQPSSVLGLALAALFFERRRL
ncbi:unnamed protein product [Adineta ricciae]|uniref:Uncharacterized protein n=1 Tax=Adineta ricciae TaxID=249248 RepID=A0A814JGU8_ADIRI|nr:unnamed protein product [Adineta ricciae]CAF1164319.1 unnamed protein product [Adineta ricciae]